LTTTCPDLRFVVDQGANQNEVKSNPNDANLIEMSQLPADPVGGSLASFDFTTNPTRDCDVLMN